MVPDSWRRTTLAVSLFLLVAVPAYADSLTLQGGSVVIGTFVGGTPDEVRFDTGEQIQSFRIADLVSLTFGDESPAPPVATSAANTDVLELRDGSRIEGRYHGGDESVIRFDVEGSILSYPRGAIRDVTFRQPETATSTPPPSGSSTTPTTAGTAPPPPPPSKPPSGGRRGGGGGGGSRVYFGGGLGLSFGAVTYIELAPLVGFRVSKRVRAGGSLIFRYRKDDRYPESISTTDYGGSVFAQYSLLKWTFLHGEYEYLQYEFVRPDLSTSRTGVSSLFGGIGFSRKTGARSSFFLLALYNFNYSDDTVQSPYSGPWVFRVGFSVGF